MSVHYSKRTKLFNLLQIAVLSAVVVIFSACGSEESYAPLAEGDTDSEGDGAEVLHFTDDEGVLPMFDPHTNDMFAFPFPSNHLIGDDGFTDFTGFPNPLPSSLIDKYTEYASTHIKGFGANSACYVRFSGAINTNNLPQPSESTSADSPVQIINITENSPDYGKRVPLLVEFHSEDSIYYPSNTLAFMPYPGFPLNPNETYALVVLKSLGDAEGNLLGAPALLKRSLAGVESDDEDENRIVSIFEPLRNCINNGACNLDVSNIAAAAVFTVQDTIGELAQIREYIRTQLPVPEMTDIERIPSAETDYYYAFDGHYTAPNFQHGEIPYASEGGNFEFDENGNPIVAKYESLRFRLVIPKNFAQPEGGYPIVMYAHGTGGDYTTFARHYSLAPANILTQKGLAVIGIDQPLHGDRKEGKEFDEGTMSFNYMNPDAGRTNFRQSAIDTFNLTWALQNGKIYVPADVSPTGKAIKLSQEKILFMGHSHGGISGSIVMGLEDGIIGSVHSGAGGMLAFAILYRKDYTDILALLKDLLGIPEEEEVSLLHPVITLIQTFVDVTDPINYAPYYVRKASAGVVHNMLYTCGFYDEQTPHQANEALITAAGFPIVEPVGWSVEGLDLRGLQPVSPPVSGNLQMPDGTPTTCGVKQYNRNENDNHFVIFRDAEAADMYGEFLKHVAEDGLGVIQ